MKMNKSLIALCLSAGCWQAHLESALPMLTTYRKTPRRASHSICRAATTHLDTGRSSKTQTTQLSTGGQQLNVSGTVVRLLRTASRQTLVN